MSQWTIKATFATLTLAFGLGCANAEPYLVADAQTGQVLFENQATQPWFPASTTKLMTTYVALNAVREGRLTLDTPLTMSVRAARSAPSKMGFKPGTLVTLDNSLKMLMVKSPNDVAVMIAEGVDGSVEAFADEMNATAAKLGMHESHFVNPNGLHDPNHYSSARDMALLARALLRDFPEHDDLYGIGAIQLGVQIIGNHNGLLGRYPGADGMKTGFTCSSGFNVVATATRNGRRLITVVFGSPSARERTDQAGQLFDRGFAQWGGGTTLEALPSAGSTQPPDMHAEICSRRNRTNLAKLEEDFSVPVTSPVMVASGRGGAYVPPAVAGAPLFAPAASIASERVHFEPVPVFIGPKAGWTGPVLAARSEPKADSRAKSDADKDAAKATAYAPDGAPDAAPLGSQDAPLALQGAVKTPAALAKAPGAKGKAATKAALAAAAKPKKPAPKPAKP